MQVREIMTTDVQSVTPDTDLITVATHMRDLDVGVVPVVENGQLTGIITDRDIVIRALASGLEMRGARVADFMTANPTSLKPTDDVQQAAQLMGREQIRRLPVVENGTLVGILSIGDVAVDTRKDHLTGNALEQISEPSEPRAEQRGH